MIESGEFPESSSPMTDRSAERRINVAASRARQQMWVVYSVDPEHLGNGDLRAELIRHCRDPRGLDEARDSAIERCESEFEKAVLSRILARGFRRVRAQYEVGSRARNYRIDLVVEGAEKRLAIECDGERWHGPDRWHADHARQQVLERAGWTFERIRGSAFYRHPDIAMQPLWQRLDALGIATGDEWLRGDGIRPATREVHGANANVESDFEKQGTALSSRLDQFNVEGSPGTGANALASQGLVDRERELIAHGVQPDEVMGAKVVTDHESATVPEVRTTYLEPYVEWHSHPVPEVRSARLAHVAAALSEIVAAEGPMHALRAYQLYVKASGGHRVGRELRSQLNHALHRAITEGMVLMINDNIEGYVDRTLYAPGSQPVVIRGLGPRQLNDVPRSEIRALIDRLGTANLGAEERTRSVLDSYGLIRLTDRAVDYVNECVTYAWNEKP